MSSSWRTARGVSPSPQVFSRGNCFFSTTITSWPASANQCAHADPAGPPPTTRTSCSAVLEAVPLVGDDRADLGVAELAGEGRHAARAGHVLAARPGRVPVGLALLRGRAGMHPVDVVRLVGEGEVGL